MYRHGMSGLLYHSYIDATHNYPIFAFFNAERIANNDSYPICCVVHTAFIRMQVVGFWHSLSSGQAFFRMPDPT